MKIKFNHAGQSYTLTKHTHIAKELRQGKLTKPQAATHPWYLRFTNAQSRRITLRLQALTKAEVIAEAKDVLLKRITRPNEFQAWLQAKDASQSITIGQLATEWLAAGLPYTKTDPRSAAAATRLRATLARALPWWQAKPAATITQTTLEDYAAHRSPALRSVDVELAALSSLSQWAVFAARLEKNPFGTRRRYAKIQQHCHQSCPADDQTLHQILGWLFESQEQLDILAAGTLTMCALTGLRPGEPSLLQRHPPLAETPTDTRQLPPGIIFPDRTGQMRMKVERLKRGQNPFVLLHPAAQEFISAWRSWLSANDAGLGRPQILFPLGTSDQTTLNRALNRATAAVNHGQSGTHPHAMRAYYVKVRRSQGADDATIAGELGQTTNGALIRSTYGDPQDLHGGQMHDWLPEDTAPAWSLLRGKIVASIVATEPYLDGNNWPNPTHPQQDAVAFY